MHPALFAVRMHPVSQPAGRFMLLIKVSLVMSIRSHYYFMRTVSSCEVNCESVKQSGGQGGGTAHCICVSIYAVIRLDRMHL